MAGLDEGPHGEDVYRALIPELAKLNLLYLHVLYGADRPTGFLKEIRQMWPHTLFVNRAGRPLETIADDIDAGMADMAPVGVWALANPDFVERLKLRSPLNVMLAHSPS